MRYSTGKRILVTGGSGFLGSHLCEKLLNQGHEVICLDNFYTGQRYNITHLLSHANFEVIRHDVVRPIHLEVDEIYNLACAASPVHYQRYPVETLQTSVLGIHNMLHMARRLRCKIFQASTSEVYGDPLVHPQKEEYTGNVNFIGTRACYDEGKRCAETLCFDFYREYKTRIKIVRIFNTYGPRMALNDGRAVSRFVIQALKGEDITIYGDGKQTRSFCFYSDMVEGFLTLMETGDDVTGPINLGNPEERTVQELAELVLKYTGSKSKIVYFPAREDDPIKRQPDISRAKKLLSWEPKVKLEDGLKTTIDYFKWQLS